MCKAFSCLVDKNKKVYWDFLLDSHDKLIQKHKLNEKKDTVDFVRIEIIPKNGSYLKPDKWVFKVDETSIPDWFSPNHKETCMHEFRIYKKQLYKIIVRKEIVHPFKDIKFKGKITLKHKLLLKEWDSVGGSVWESVRESVWDSIWESVRDSVGDSIWESVWGSVWGSVRGSVGDSIWDSVGGSVWESVWESVRDSIWESVRGSVGGSVRGSVRDSVGDSIWESVGGSVWGSVRDSVGDSIWESVRGSVGGSVRDSVGDSIWESVWGSVWGYVGSFFRLKREQWKFTEKIQTTGYPFQSVVDLWMMGLVPSFDGTTWRLHAGEKGKIIFEITKDELMKIKEK